MANNPDQHLLLCQRHRIHERLPRRLAIAPASLVGAAFVVLLEPRVQVGSQFFQVPIELLAERDPIEFLPYMTISIGTMQEQTVSW